MLFAYNAETGAGNAFYQMPFAGNNRDKSKREIKLVSSAVMIISQRSKKSPCADN